MKLRLIRHGQTPNNVARVLDTAEPGALLTQLGHDQAEALPQKLVTVSIDSLYVSTLTRTQLTAQPLARASASAAAAMRFTSSRVNALMSFMCCLLVCSGMCQLR